jgi:hypothetical protein
MQRQELMLEIDKLMGAFIGTVDRQKALGLADVNTLSEALLLELLRELFMLPDLRSLNNEKANFPGLDLADDTVGVAFQITTTRELKKVLNCLETVIRHDLHNRFSRIVVLIVGNKQNSYSQAAIDRVVGGRFTFNASSDVVDQFDLLTACSKLDLEGLERVVDVLRRNITGLSIPDCRMRYVICKDPQTALALLEGDTTRYPFERSYLAPLGDYGTFNRKALQNGATCEIPGRSFNSMDEYRTTYAAGGTNHFSANDFPYYKGTRVCGDSEYRSSVAALDGFGRFLLDYDPVLSEICVAVATDVSCGTMTVDEKYLVRPPWSFFLAITN